jgi:DNA-binding PadR family transcriptional regulator
VPFLQLSQGFVYPTLKRLAQDELIVEAGPRSEGPAKPSRMRYEVSEHGTEEFGRWMWDSPPPAAFRDELLAKLAFARPDDLPHLIDVTRTHEALLRRQLGELREPLGDEWLDIDAVPWVRVGTRLVQATEAKRIATAIESLQEIRATMERWLQGPQRRSGRGRGGR